MPKGNNNKDEKQKNAKHKDEKQKRAKGINKSAPPRRAQKANFLARIFPSLYNIPHTKEKKAECTKKRQKNAAATYQRVL